MEPDILAASMFVSKLNGIIRTAGPAGTCANCQGRDKVLDYVVCSPEASPFLKTIRAVRSVPWKPHQGLAIQLRSSGLQLLTRPLVVSPRLPQAPRPRREPTAGSKSSLSRARQAIAQQEALEARRQHFLEMFGGCFHSPGVPSSSAEGVGQAPPDE
eukprot:9436113-Pyramimonas_sp.AAC.1